MRIIGLISALALLCTSTAAADDLQLEAGQAWGFKDAPSAEARVIIGKIEREFDPMIVHVAVEGLPNLERSPEPLAGGIRGRGAGRNENRFWCQYTLTPSLDNKSVEISIFYMPIEYNAFKSSLTSLEASGVSMNEYFERAYDDWDYFRDQWETEGTHAAIATKPLAESVQMVMASARGLVSTMKLLRPELERLLKERNKQ